MSNPATLEWSSTGAPAAAEAEAGGVAEWEDGKVRALRPGSSQHRSGSTVLEAEEYGDHFIKETDDSRINKHTGVGACALHPCLTRRAAGVSSLASEPVAAAPVPAAASAEHAHGPQRPEEQAQAGGGKQMLAQRPIEEGERVPASAPLPPQDYDAAESVPDEELLDLLIQHTVSKGDQKQQRHAAGSMREPTARHPGSSLGALGSARLHRKEPGGGSKASPPGSSSATLMDASSVADLTQQFSKQLSTSSGHSKSALQLQQQEQELHLGRQLQGNHYLSSATKGAAATPTSTPRGGLRISTQSDQSPANSLASSGARLTQKKLELEKVGKRHSEATAAAVRSMERSQGSLMRRTGADTPTVDLVETAVSVREVSKLIGRTVVQMNNVRRIMIVTKPNDTSLISLTRDLAIWLMESATEESAQPLVVYIEEYVAQHRNFNLPRVHKKHPISQTNIQLWTPQLCATSPELFDFVVTLGGDGTVLYTSWLFQTTVPPIIPFHLGSLGFLTVFDHRHARRVLGSAIHAGVRINLRMRFTCTVYRLADTVDPQRANVLVDAADCNRVIDHELATRGLESTDERVCADVSGSAKLAAINSMSNKQAPSRSFSSSQKRPPQRSGSSGNVHARSGSGASVNSNNGRSHARRRSSVNSSSAGESSAQEGEPGRPAVRTPSMSSASRHSRRHRGQHSKSGGSPGAGKPARVLSQSPEASERNHTNSEAQRNSASGRSPPTSSSVFSHAGSSSNKKSDAGARGMSMSGSTASISSTASADNARGDELLEQDEDGLGVPQPEGAPVTRNSTVHESEWEDVPKAYQRRVRKVWKRGESFQVMNELVVDRGPSPYLSQIELYGDGNHLTTVEADGLCLATPTGSTAYSLAAGGSLVHPEIPAILVTPICPHTLSFRPMLLPDSMVLRVVLPPDSRNTAWASFDGRHRIELRRGDHIQITASKYPLPTVCASQSQTQDWMASLSRCLNWNERKRQKKFSSTGGDAGQGKMDDGLSDDGGNAEDEDSALEDDDYDDHAQPFY